jgi:hypothetical protein
MKHVFILGKKWSRVDFFGAWGAEHRLAHTRADRLSKSRAKKIAWFMTEITDKFNAQVIGQANYGQIRGVREGRLKNYLETNFPQSRHQERQYKSRVSRKFNLPPEDSNRDALSERSGSRVGESSGGGRVNLLHDETDLYGSGVIASSSRAIPRRGLWTDEGEPQPAFTVADSTSSQPRPDPASRPAIPRLPVQESSHERDSSALVEMNKYTKIATLAFEYLSRVEGVGMTVSDKEAK